MRIPFLRVAAAVLAIALAFPALSLEKFDSEAHAQHHCPTDIVVWLNLPTMIWHTRGERWYGAIKNGAFVCRAEAAAEGARGSRNGQQRESIGIALRSEDRSAGGNFRGKSYYVGPITV
jgi:hypothetical protein